MSKKPIARAFLASRSHATATHLLMMLFHVTPLYCDVDLLPGSAICDALRIDPSRTVLLRIEQCI